MDNAEPLVTRDTFTLFPKLPPELRIKIWGFVLEPRVVAIKGQVAIQGRDIDKWTYFSERCGKAPSLLQVNAEARSIAMIRYRLSFSNVVGGPTYFDFEKDTLHLRGFLPEWLSSPWNEDFTKVQNLAIWFNVYSRVENLESRLEHFKNLKNVTVYNDTYIGVPVGSTSETIDAVLEIHDKKTQELFDRLWTAFQESLSKREEGKVFTLPNGVWKPAERIHLIDPHTHAFSSYIRI
jgi:hypothetical protein